MAHRLADVLISLEGCVGVAIKNCNLLSLWGEVVDERAGKHAEAVKIKNRTLYVSTSTSTWAQELSFLKEDIIKKFNQRAGREVIRDVMFRSK